MCKINREEEIVIENVIYLIMRKAVGNDYARCIMEDKDNETKNTFTKDVIENVIRCSNWENKSYYNDDDVRLAIGRVLIDRLGIDY